MVERPILFSGPMVKALLAGRKTQTRRIIFRSTPTPGRGRLLAFNGTVATFGDDIPDDPVPIDVRCPYGAPGDRLWVRERQRVIGLGPVTRRATAIRVRYEADGAESSLLPYPKRLNGKPEIGKCLAYGGYRESSRITLAVESVRVERLQSITDEDARAEGVEPFFTRCPSFGRDQTISTGERAADAEHRASFAVLWDEINGDRALWTANPWVWVVGFAVVSNCTEQPATGSRAAG